MNADAIDSALRSVSVSAIRFQAKYLIVGARRRGLVSLPERVVIELVRRYGMRKAARIYRLLAAYLGVLMKNPLGAWAARGQLRVLIRLIFR